MSASLSWPRSRSLNPPSWTDLLCLLLSSREPRPVELSLGERQMLMEYITGQLLKRETADPATLPINVTLLSKLAARSHASDIPLQLLSDFIVNNADTKSPSNPPSVDFCSPRHDTVHELAVQLLFELYTVYGCSPCIVPDLDRLFQTPFNPTELKHPYDRTLHAILESILGSDVEGRDKVLKRLLLDVPALPPTMAFHFFKKLLHQPSTAVTFLISASALMDSHPVLKPIVLECILGTCIGEDAETREKGIRLVKNRLHQDQELAPRIEAFASDALDQVVDVKTENEASPGRLSHLYLALCTRKASLLRHLLEVYGRADEDGKCILEESTKQLSEAVNFLLPELLALIEDCPENAEPLLLLLLSIFPGKVPPQKIVDACLERYQSSGHVRYLLPVLPALPKEHVMDVIPSLTQLPLNEFVSTVTELVQHLPFGDPCIEPSEILVALGSRSESHPEFASVRSALDYCIKEMSDVFDKEVLAGALNKLTHMHTLPVLFMRMMLLSIGRENELETFVLQTVLSPSVVTSKIRTDGSQWQGYLLLLQRTQPASFGHLLTLTTKVMIAAVKELPICYARLFLAFVESDKCGVRVPNDAVEALKDIVDNRSVDHVHPLERSSVQSDAMDVDQDNG